MRVFLTGVSCVGKTAIGRRLAELVRVQFFDLDQEIERFFETSIERLRNKFMTMHSFREEASKALTYVWDRPDSRDCVIALPPSGLMSAYLRTIKKTSGITVVLDDMPENILARIAFYDIDSRPIEKELTHEEKRTYLREIKKDITYFRRSYERATTRVDITGLDVDEAARKIKHAVRAADRKMPKQRSPEQPAPGGRRQTRRR